MRSDAFVRVSCDVCEDPGMDEEVILCALAGAGGTSGTSTRFSIGRDGGSKGRRIFARTASKTGRKHEEGAEDTLQRS